MDTAKKTGVDQSASTGDAAGLSADAASSGLSRRNFLISTAGAGAGLALSRKAFAQGGAGGADDLNVALIGMGAEGMVLMDACLRIPGIRFKAVCDIWSYSQRRGSRTLKKHGHEVNVYEDYRDLLAKEKDLDAAVIATPDFVHHEHAIACMEAGLDVYCEKEMSNSLEKARMMVEAQRRTGKLLQIGHQRRSNPRYRHAVYKLIREARLMGRVTQAYGQWNRAKSADLGWPKKYVIPDATLHKYGYQSMQHFRNWRWYKKYGGGPIVDLGSHQIDIFSWVFESNPVSVMAGGGIDFYKYHEWYDNVMTIFEYDTPEGRARAFYQVLTTTSNGGFYETFMGVDGTLVISELPTLGNYALRETHAPEWDKWVKNGYLKSLAKRPPAPAVEADEEAFVDVRVSPELKRWAIPVTLNKPAHQPHLENFFDAVRNGTDLNCPVEVGYETAVAVLTVNKAVESGQKLSFKPEDFEV